MRSFLYSGSSKWVQAALSASMIVALVESVLFPSQNAIVGPPFAIGVASVSLRLLDLSVIAVWICALVSHPVRRRPIALIASASIAIAWVLLSWILISLHDSSLGTVLTELRWLLYLLILCFALTRIDLFDIGAAARHSLLITSPLLIGAALLSVAGTPGVALPGLPGSAFGLIGGDLATVVGCLAILSLVGGRSVWALLIFMPLLTEQRAAMIGTTVVGGLLLAFYLMFIKDLGGGRSGAWHSPKAVVSAAFAVAGVALLIGANLRGVSDNITALIAGAFEGEGKVASAGTRVYQLQQSWDLFLSSPVVGVGTGRGIVYFYDEFANRFVETSSAHNAVADVAIRWGVVGLVCVTAIFAVAFCSKRYVRSRLSFLPAAALISVLVKSLLEPAFDKYRLAYVIALCVVALYASSQARLNTGDGHGGGGGVRAGGLA